MSKIKTGIKMVVNPKQSRKIQEICFENDIGWASGTHLKHLDEPFIYINNDYLLVYGDISGIEFFNKNKNEEVSAELFIRTNGTCVESETPTEDNKKEEQIEELKLECLIEGYEGAYFEIGQVWETREGDKLKVKGFDYGISIYKLTMTEVGDSTEEYYYSSNGERVLGRESELNLIKLISTETTPSAQSEQAKLVRKTLSGYLKENNAYEAFIENCVEEFSNDIDAYNEIKIKSKECSVIGLGSAFIWHNTEQGSRYWSDLFYKEPENLIDDMSEIIFAEVDKRIAEQKAQSEFISTEEFEQMLEQKTSTRYMVFVEGRSKPKKVHDSYASAEKEAKRLSAKEIGCNVNILSVVKTFKSKVIVEEV